MNSHGLTKENLVATLPVALQKDPSAVALAEAMAELLASRLAEIDRLRIYPDIDRLDEPLLDILAYDFKVDWWDADYSLEEKRRTLKDSWYVHKKLGTKSAVETAIRAIYPKTEVEPWFQYDGGQPYHFRLKIDLTQEQWVEGKPWSVIERVQYYKSLRDHMDSIQYTMTLPPAVLQTGGGAGAQLSAGVPLQSDQCDFTAALHTGGGVSLATCAGIPEKQDRPLFRDAVHTGVTGASSTAMPVPEDTTQLPAPTILRTGGVCTIISQSKGE